jgi:hypothetical protein
MPWDIETNLVKFSEVMESFSCPCLIAYFSTHHLATERAATCTHISVRN